jgi:hypothetical protein
MNERAASGCRPPAIHSPGTADALRAFRPRCLRVKAARFAVSALAVVLTFFAQSHAQDPCTLVLQEAAKRLDQRPFRLPDWQGAPVSVAFDNPLHRPDPGFISGSVMSLRECENLGCGGTSYGEVPSARERSPRNHIRPRRPVSHAESRH